MHRLQSETYCYFRHIPRATLAFDLATMCFNICFHQKEALCVNLLTVTLNCSGSRKCDGLTYLLTYLLTSLWTCSLEHVPFRCSDNEIQSCTGQTYVELFSTQCETLVTRSVARFRRIPSLAFTISDFEITLISLSSAS